MTTARRKKPVFEPGLIPGPGELLVWSDARHFDGWQTRPCTLCGAPTPLRSHAGEPAHKECAEDWIAAHPAEARRSGRFASNVRPKKPKDSGHA
jgi:hypothetical protein